MFKLLGGDFPASTICDGNSITWGFGKDKTLNLYGVITQLKLISKSNKEVQFSCTLNDGRSFIAKSDLKKFESIEILYQQAGSLNNIAQPNLTTPIQSVPQNQAQKFSDYEPVKNESKGGLFISKCKQCGKSGLLLKLSFDGLCEDCFRQKESNLQLALSPEQHGYLDLKDAIRHLEEQRDQLQASVSKTAGELRQLYDSVEERKKLLVDLDDKLSLQEFALYEPKYSFCTAEEYKNRLTIIRQQQKEMVRDKTAVLGQVTWQLNGSAAQGKKMVQDMQKLLLRAFNSECDELVDKVKFNNYETYSSRIMHTWETTSKLGAVMSISIAPEYRDLKLQELTLAFEYQQKKQLEKEEQKEIRAAMREEARIQKELEEQRRKVEKEQSHYQNALQKIQQQLLTSNDPDLMDKKREIESHLTEIGESLTQIDYRQANQRAGYVYVISNIGSFGENTYKIGMTRRLEPMERIDELGDASVPFDFDVHAMIFSEDAPKLEAALHNAFADKKVNMVNTRREFFHVTLEEIKEVVRKNYDKTAEFVDLADAEQYRVSQKLLDDAIVGISG